MILLINPPQIFSYTMTSPCLVPPLGLLYIASALKAKGHKVHILDSVIEGINNTSAFSGNVQTRGLAIPDIVDIVKNIRPDVVGISNMFSFAYPVVSELSKQIKMALPQLNIILGGAHPSAVPYEVLKNTNIDFAVISEGEETIVQLIDELNTTNSYAAIDGLGFKINNNIVINPKKRFIDALDDIPFPARDMIPLDKYYKAKESHGTTQGKWTTMISSRGCPYGCTFCTPNLWGRRYRVRSAMNVLVEMEECYRKYGIKEFHFEDENLTINKERLLEICRGIRKIDPDIKWQAPNGIRASVTDAEILRAMKESGCEHITVAPESGSLRVLNEIIHKRQNLDHVTKVVKEAKDIGLKTLAYFIMGLPGETKEDIEMTIAYIKMLASSGLDEVGISNYIPLPGSELYSDLEQKGRLKIGVWFDLLSIADMSRSFSWSENITNEELQRFRKRGYIVFHFAKLLYHPLNVIGSIMNIVTGKQTLKTERVTIAMIKRRINGLLRLLRTQITI